MNVSRREFLNRHAMGIGSVALAWLLQPGPSRRDTEEHSQAAADLRPAAQTAASSARVPRR